MTPLSKSTFISEGKGHGALLLSDSLVEAGDALAADVGSEKGLRSMTASFDLRKSSTPAKSLLLAAEPLDALDEPNPKDGVELVPLELPPACPLLELMSGFQVAVAQPPPQPWETVPDGDLTP